MLLPVLILSMTNLGSPVIELNTLQMKSLTPAEQVVAQTLQGLTAKKPSKIWIENGGVQEQILRDLRIEGAEITPAKSVWDLVSKFRKEVKGVIVYQLGTPSLNVATGLCGPMKAIAVDASLLGTPAVSNLKILLDARGMTESQAFAQYAGKYGKGYVVEQAVTKPGHLRDFAVAHSAFTMDTDNHEFRQQVVRAAGPNALAFGWGRDEYEFVADVSRAGGTVAPADWCTNLSVLEQLPVAKLAPPKMKRIAKPEKGVRYVAFVLSDGDNLQVLTGGFATDKAFYGSKLRGTFPFTWEVPAILSKYAPRVLKAVYDAAKPNDDFIAGAGQPGYTFPAFHPDRTAIAKQSFPFLAAAGLNTFGVLNANDGSLADLDPWFTNSKLMGAVYKDYAPYDRRHGEIRWVNGKPIFAFRFMLWEGLEDIDPLAKSINAMPAKAESSLDSYALVTVHAWSYGKIGGPVEATKRVIDKLDSNTRVITANQLLDLVRRNFAPK